MIGMDETNMNNGNVQKDISEEKDKIYKDVVLKIRDIVKGDLLDNKTGFGEEKQKEVMQVLEDNFNINDQIMGRIFLENKIMFNKDTGDNLEITVPFFTCPVFIGYGYKILMPNNCYPIFDIKNKYMGYWDGGKFHKVPSRIEKFLKNERFVIAFLMVASIYVIILVLVSLGSMK